MRSLLIGKAGELQEHFTRLTADPAYLARGPHKYLFFGPPGVGKSDLAGRIAEMLDADGFSTVSYNGKEVTVGLVRQWINETSGDSVLGGWLVYLIDEMDRSSRDAQDLMLTWLDCLPKKTFVIATSNLDLENLQERLQTRFQQIAFKPAADEAIIKLLTSQGVPKDEAADIAGRAEGRGC